MSGPENNGGPRPRGPTGRGVGDAARVAGVVRFLAGLPGIVAVKAVGSSLLESLLAEESAYECSAFLPLVNAGVRQVLARDAAVALVKDQRFREPPGPTVYLVERLDASLPGGESAAVPHSLEVGGQRFRVLGEEVLEGRKPYTEKTLFLADSFVLFPERRASPRTPSFFLMPPLGFAELEERQAEMGLRNVISISPSSLSDRLLREECGFPPETSLATLLVGFDWAVPGGPSAP